MTIMSGTIQYTRVVVKVSQIFGILLIAYVAKLSLVIKDSF